MIVRNLAFWHFLCINRYIIDSHAEKLFQSRLAKPEEEQTV
jgi:hypothetical protein